MEPWLLSFLSQYVNRSKLWYEQLQASASKPTFILEHSRGRLLCSCPSFPQQRDTMKVTFSHFQILTSQWEVKIM